MAEDNWKHRGKGMRCRTCMFFVEKVNEIAAPASPERCVAPETSPGTQGRCRRHAPTTVGFPVVFESDWCGDHKLA